MAASSSTNSTVTYTITFQEAGPYTIVLHQGYYNKRYTLTGAATGATNYKEHGLLLNDANGNPRMSPLKRQPRIVGSISGTGPWKRASLNTIQASTALARQNGLRYS